MSLGTVFPPRMDCYLMYDFERHQSNLLHSLQAPSSGLAALSTGLQLQISDQREPSSPLSGTRISASLPTHGNTT